ncbi:PEP-CTERM sorting domain-containing protein [Calycomorphotria hydatis]|uniref:Ice-binding protein C-terminal domain-containing protein n=1 Tax=Calycomorphotria hydatis TaxID=2528027 RepID=A0A517T3B0_9PLAN|nr:PEP-CTERM sorting domain-containing protein [Calycomorphotria hydatis]QDT62863.1 hypothetical protein V22_00610 [Calycomorphotria hydatis]
MGRSQKLLTIAILFLFSRAAIAAPFFIGVGGIDTPIDSQTGGLSGDGQTAVGRSENNAGDDLPFVWTLGTGIQQLPILPGHDEGRARSVTPDGNIIVGQSESPTGQEFAVRWVGGVIQPHLGFLPGHDEAFARVVSADGQTIAGFSRSSTTFEQQAFVWTSGGGMQALPFVAGAINPNSNANGISADGTLIAGTSSDTSGNPVATLWVNGTPQLLGDLGGGFSEGLGIASNGSVVVGASSTSAFDNHAIRYLVGSSTLEDLGVLPGYEFSSASGVSGDGSIIGGTLQDYDTGEISAFLWTQTDGMRLLTDVLTNDYGLGASIAGWELRDLERISDDGLTFYGDGRNPDGDPEAFIISLSGAAVVPEPSALILAGLGGLGLLVASRRKKLTS